MRTLIKAGTSGTPCLASRKWAIVHVEVSMEVMLKGEYRLVVLAQALVAREETIMLFWEILMLAVVGGVVEAFPLNFAVKVSRDFWRRSRVQAAETMVV